MGLFTLHNYCVPFLFDYLITYLEFKSRLPIPEFSGYHCIISDKMLVVPKCFYQFENEENVSVFISNSELLEPLWNSYSVILKPATMIIDIPVLNENEILIKYFYLKMFLNRSDIFNKFLFFRTSTSPLLSRIQTLLSRIQTTSFSSIPLKFQSLNKL